MPPTKIISKPDIQNIMQPLDWVVFSIVILLTIFAVVYGHKRKDKSEENNGMLDLLVMGRQLTLPLFVATLVATWYGGILGVTKISFEYGIYNFISQGVFWYVTYLLFALFVVQKIKSYQAVTLPDLIGQMFGPKSARISAFFNFFNVVPIAYTIGLGIILQAFLGGSLFTMMCCGILLVIIYSTFGGFRAVVFSDLVQFFVMCLGVFLIFLFSVYYFGGVSFLQSSLPKSHFSLTGGNSLLSLFSWGLIALSTLVDPNFYQRCFAAKNTKVAKKGIFISTIIWVGFDLCTTAGGMYARAVIPESEPNLAYLNYGLQLLPTGLRGLFIAGIVATILSTLDSYIFIAGTTLTHDILPEKFKESKKAHYIGIIFVGILSIIMAQVFNGDIKTVWKTLGSYSSACLLIPVLMGYIFPGKIRDFQFFLSCLTSLVTTTVWRNVDRVGFWKDIDEIYIGSLTSILVIILYWKINKREPTI